MYISAAHIALLPYSRNSLQGIILFCSQKKIFVIFLLLYPQQEMHRGYMDSKMCASLCIHVTSQ